MKGKSTRQRNQLPFLHSPPPSEPLPLPLSLSYIQLPLLSTLLHNNAASTSRKVTTHSIFDSPERVKSSTEGTGVTSDLPLICLAQMKVKALRVIHEPACH
jgi:hypothetical protein